MKASVFVGVSLDGFLARPEGSFDFLTASGAEQDNGYEAFMATVDVLVIGRHTYEIVRAFPQWPYASRKVVVLSSRPLGAIAAGADVELASGSPAGILALLEGRGFQHAYVDGGITIQAFIQAGLIDRMVITRVPVLVGSGISLFGALTQDIWLRHLSTRVLSAGAVQSEYALRAPARH